MWIVTMDVNDYRQHGSYFIGAYLTKPTAEQLKKLLGDKADIEGLLSKEGVSESGLSDASYDLSYCKEGEGV